MRIILNICIFAFSKIILLKITFTKFFFLIFLHIFSQKMWHSHKKFDIIFTMFIVFHNIVKSVIREIFA